MELLQNGVATYFHDETDAWCKRALKTMLNRKQIEKFKEEYQVPSDILDFPLHLLCFLNISECIRGPNSIEIKYIIK